MNSKFENEILTVYPVGRIDTYNAEEAEREINSIKAEHPNGDLVMDADKLDYISSSGLRVILRLKKANPSFKLINVNPDVYEIFDMTGFTEMMTVEKAYRQVSVEGCEVIGRGANGKVYRINDDTIVKVYANPTSTMEEIKRERELAKKAFVLGIPTAISYDVVKVGENFGTVFELLNAKSFAKLISENPEGIDGVIDMYVDLLKKIHSTTVKEGDMPDQREVAIKWAKFDMEYLPEEIGRKLLKLFEDLPKDNHLLHGDYHIKNVMLQNGEALLIDMDTLCLGHPILEFGPIYSAYIGFSVIDRTNTMDFLGISYETAVEIWHKTISKYLGTNDEKVLKAFEEKAIIVGYTRLLRRTIKRMGFEDATGAKLIEYYRNALIELVPKVDSLLY